MTHDIDAFLNAKKSSELTLQATNIRNYHHWKVSENTIQHRLWLCFLDNLVLPRISCAKRTLACPRIRPQIPRPDKKRYTPYRPPFLTQNKPKLLILLPHLHLPLPLHLLLLVFLRLLLLPLFSFCLFLPSALFCTEAASLGIVELLDLEQESMVDVDQVPPNSAVEAAARQLDREQ